MTTHAPLVITRTRNLWLTSALLGAALGGIVLGVGGRIAMRGMAIWENSPRIWSIEGTITVVGLGIVCGVIGGLLRTALARWLPRRLPAWTQTALFSLIWFALGLRILSPIEPHRLVLFVPLIVLSLVVLEWRWRTLSTRAR